jgi:predicted outer membrane repeat protein
MDLNKLLFCALTLVLAGAGSNLTADVRDASDEGLTRAAFEPMTWRGISGSDRERGEPERGGESRSARATFSVGGDAACDFADLNQALGSGLLGPGDVVNVASSASYSGLTYLINNRTGQLTLRGGFSSCAELVPDQSTTVLDAAGSGRVMYIESNSDDPADLFVVNLENLTLRGGSSAGSFGGGGLLINGRPGAIQVNLRNVNVQNNHSTVTGGGIRVRQSGERVASGPMLTADNASIIGANSSDGNGGGLSCESLVAPSTSTLIRLGTVAMLNNSAENGGAMSLRQCGRVWFYGGYSLLGIVGNQANDAGGGFYLEGDGSDLRLSASDFNEWGHAEHGVMVSGNSAGRGGAIYARDASYVQMFDVHVVNNSATNGSGLFANAGPAEIIMQRPDGTNACTGSTGFGSTARCSVLSGNTAASSATLFARNDAAIRVSRTLIENNSASFGVIGTVSGAGPGQIGLESVLISGNDGIEAFDTINGRIDLRWSTVTDNEFSTSIIRAASSHEAHASDFRAIGSILWEDGIAIVGTADEGSTRADCVIGWLSEIDSGFSTVAFYRQVDPEFTDPSSGDYRPGPTSPAIDFCDDFYAPEYADLIGTTRGQMHEGDPLSPGGASVGLFDLGAWEMQYRTDELFRDRFAN